MQQSNIAPEDADFNDANGGIEFDDLSIYLNLARNMAHKCVERHTIRSRDLCPVMFVSDSDRVKAAKRVASINREINGLHASMLSIEMEHEFKVGVSAIIGPMLAKERAK